jgi:hypothetical protein
VVGIAALHTTAERDPIDPLPREVRRSVADRLFRASGLQSIPVPSAVAVADSGSILAVHFPPGVEPAPRTTFERRYAAR